MAVETTVVTPTPGEEVVKEVAADAAATKAAAEATAATAAATAALANGSAAAAKVDAVEREREIIGKVATWQDQTTTEVQALRAENAEIKSALSGISGAMERLSSALQAKPTVAVVTPQDKKPPEKENQDDPKAPEKRSGRRML